MVMFVSVTVMFTYAVFFSEVLPVAIILTLCVPSLTYGARSISVYAAVSAASCDCMATVPAVFHSDAFCILVCIVSTASSLVSEVLLSDGS